MFGLIDTDTFAVDPVNIHPASTLSNSIKKTERIVEFKPTEEARRKKK